MFVAVRKIRDNARHPGLHKSLSSWPMITANASIKTNGSIPPSKFICFPLNENGPEKYHSVK